MSPLRLLLPIPCLLPLAAVPAVPVAPVAPAGPRSEGSAALERAFTDAWAAGDAAALAACRERIAGRVAEHPEDARAHYLEGLSLLVGRLRTNAVPDSADVDATLRDVARAVAAFERALELDPGEGDACAGAALAVVQRFVLGRGEKEDAGLLGKWVRAGAEVAPEAASTRLLAAWTSSSQASAAPGGMAAVLDRFFELGTSVRLEVEESGAAPGFWELFTQGMAARALVFAPRPEPGRAAELVDGLLALSPDCRMARAFLLPFVTEREPLPPAAWRDLAWSELAAEVEPDGKVPGLADAAAVSYARDAAGSHWLRIELQGPPNADVFGWNVVIDADGTRRTGSAWWGGDKTFVFDRLASAWVARDEHGAYRGAVGVTDDVAALNGEMTNTCDACVGFGVDEGGAAFLVRLDADVLPPGSRFLVAVGSNAQWSDDVPDAGGLALPAAR